MVNLEDLGHFDRLFIILIPHMIPFCNPLDYKGTHDWFGRYLYTIIFVILGIVVFLSLSTFSEMLRKSKITQNLPKIIWKLLQNHPKITLNHLNFIPQLPQNHQNHPHSFKVPKMITHKSPKKMPLVISTIPWQSG